MSWLKYLLSRRRMDGELSEEMRAHLEEKVEALIAGGMSKEEAGYAARREFGNLGLVEEDSRAVWQWSTTEDIWTDLRHGLRLLAKSPGFTLVAVLTLALGVGANTAIFSYINAWLIKPLPYPQADKLMVFVSHDRKAGWTRDGLMSTASFLEFQQQNSSFEETALWTGWNFNLTGDGPPTLIESGRVSWNYFDTLGVKPILGRTFAPEEDRPGAGHVAILAEGLWKSRYAADPKIIGRLVTIEGEPYTVIGVMPGTFQFPLMGLANVWTPLALSDGQRADRGDTGLLAFGRLKSGATREQADAESAAFFLRLEQQFPETNRHFSLLVSSMSSVIARIEGGPEITICFIMVGLILLIACANVANLVMARMTSRTRELVVRGALGATRSRLLRQLLTESLLLFFFGGVAGALFGIWGTHWIQLQIPNHLRGFLVNYGHVEMDVTTLLFSLGIALLCGLIFGFAPAFENTRLNINQSLKEGTTQISGSKSGSRMRRIFVSAEIAMAVLVLICTTLLVKSFLISVHLSPGYNAANVMTAQLTLPKTKYPDDARLRNFNEQILARLQSLPHADSVAAASSIPFGGFGAAVEVSAVGKPLAQEEEKRGARFTAVSPNYFTAMQIGLLKGRWFDSSDASGKIPSAIVSQTFVKQMWPNEDPIGRQIQFGTQHTVCTIVGVVNDVKMYNLRARPEMQLYVSLRQFPSQTLGFVVRNSGDSSAMTTAIRDSIWDVDRDQPISSVEALDTLMAMVGAGNRVVSQLMVAFGLLAMFLGAIGIYGLMSQLVAQRTNEIGVRSALGATPLQIMSMIMREGLRLGLVGVGMGVLVALVAARGLAFLLYGVTPSDPLTFIGVPLLFVTVTAAACFIPGRRAMRVDPMIALRYE
jgi:putative ABC transport system permease protein